MDLPTPGARKKLRMPVVAALLVLWCAFALSPLLRAPLLYDDESLVGKDPFISSAASENAGGGALFDSLWFQPRPVRQLSHRLDAVLFGSSLAWPHAENIALHVLAGLLFLALLGRLGVDDRIRTWAFGLFLLNPVCVESVGILSHRKELLSAAFLLSAVLASMSAGARVRWLALLFLPLAVFSKETALVFPALWLVVLLARARNGRRAEGKPFHEGVWRPCVLYVLMAVLLLVAVRLQIEAGMRVIGADPGADPDRAGHLCGASLPHSVSVAFRAFPRYLLSMSVPWGHSIDPPFSLDGSFVTIATIAGLASFALFCFATVRALRSKSPFFPPLAWILVSLAPYLFPPLIGSGATAVFCDRYAYLASFGFSWFLAVAIRSFAGRIRRPNIATVAVLTACAAFSLCGFRTAQDYRSAESLWARCVRLNPASFQALYNHAWALWKETRDMDAARREFERMADLRPSFSFGMCGYADFLAENGEAEAAVSVVERALGFRPERSDLLEKRAETLLLAERFREAVSAFRRAASSGARSARFQYGWAEACKRSLFWPEAVEHYVEAARLDPSFQPSAARYRLLVRDPDPPPGAAGIVVVGDSVPHGSDALDGDGAEHSLAERIARRIPGLPFCDRTEPGSLALELQTAMPGVAETGSFKPEWCIIMTGHNDAFFGRSPAEILFDISGCVFAARTAGMHPLVIGPIPVESIPNRNRDQQERALAQVDRRLSAFCSSARISFLSARRILASRLPPADGWLLPESGNHLQTIGLEVLADACADFLTKRGH